MAKFLKLTLAGGTQKRYVNADYIAEITPVGEESSIWLTKGQAEGWLRVKESPDQILSQLAGSEPRGY